MALPETRHQLTSNHMLCLQTIVIKIGSAVITNEDKTLNEKVVKHLAEQISELYQEGHRILIVTSGGVAAGRGIGQVKDIKKRAVRRHMYAGMGQAKLIWQYSQVFENHQIPIAQCLITRDNFADKGEFDNLMTTLNGYLKCRIIPIVNENDIIANNGVNFGGNDLLAAFTAVAIKADKLIILSDVDALYDKDPHKNNDAKALHEVEKVTEEVEKLCGGSSSSIGLGGMIQKMQAIKISTEAGIKTFLGKGTEADILHNLVDTKKPVGTYFKAQKNNAPKRFKHWLKYCALPKGTMVVDEGAAKAVLNHKSLLMVGILDISDGVEKGDTVYIVDQNNRRIGTGEVNVDSKTLKDALQKKENLGVVIHTDNLSVHD